MTGYRTLRARAQAAIPDSPATVEARALALDPSTFVHAIERGWLLIAADGTLACVHGDADAEARDALLDIAGFDGVLLLPDAPGVAPGASWAVERARILTASPASLANEAREATRLQSGVIIRDLAAGDSITHLSAPLRGDIERARRTREVNAAFVDGLPVAFAYVSLETERHGDLSVDTQEGWQRRGLGAAVLRPVIAGLVARGVRPVWGAVESNAASLGLARRLGFTETAGTLLAATRLAA